ncbi:stalk domain-containing protein [Sedimentibacter sp. B4]|uniref:stalk domain-containing protein n=1 Tax=Sedimentibacter sp. B4 TaxID=304766 RepID=UPI000309D54B|nr:stalk domain-containing protein [Sedimentibacter sp. B4]
MKVKKVILSFIICTLLVINIKTAFANSLLQKIDVLINSISLYVNNEQVTVSNFLFNGTTYVPLRSVAEMNGMEVKWDGENKRVDLISSETFNMKVTDGKYNIIGANPKPFTDGNYFKWNYLMIVFDANTKKMKDNSKVVLIDNKGNRINVESQSGMTAKDNFLIIPKNQLELNTYYSLYIPKDNIVMENGDLYGEEILIYFKTATNAIRGSISSEGNLFGKSVAIRDLNGNEYITNVVGKNEFYFSDIPSERYNVTISGNSFGNISVEENIINNVKVIGE